MTSATPHRIDGPSDGILHPLARPHLPGLDLRVAVGGAARQFEASGQASGSQASSGRPRQAAGEKNDPRIGRDWLHLHAAELVERLQAWAADLDAREAQLNARASLEDHRERQFRLRQQVLAADLGEQQRSIERQRVELAAQARRLAFAWEAGSLDARGDSSPTASNSRVVADCSGACAQ